MKHFQTNFLYIFKIQVRIIALFYFKKINKHIFYSMFEMKYTFYNKNSNLFFNIVLF